MKGNAENGRDLRRYEARKLARIVGLAVWSRMAGVGLDSAERTWGAKICLLDDAFDAALKEVPEELAQAQRVHAGTGDAPSAKTMNTVGARIGAFNALQGMPRDMASTPST